ncbi:hypothetical protein G647_02448 [Cladophialophora carrionii CBS 160.54]|uniref:F-box domain-containing protein n=1 Tax=Cladophialophora carrionii CBS 160.54 TaxID=1279043 RepID=V9DFK5_9EURO|nr:uncharacterized protein G647_02448 [Cladophialophora carrionii CBS 160.54]ETI25674.1 hypothetical protein G647_02448 [Cladophialophora carrionii CBS 160.54]
MARPAILDLEVEILASIFEFVDDQSPRSTAAVAQVCKQFNSAVEYIRYRRVTIQWHGTKCSWVDSKSRIEQDWQNPDLLRGLRHLTVCRGDLPALVDEGEDELADNVNSNEDENDPLTTMGNPFGQLKSVLRDASNLKTLVWKVGYFPPLGITKALYAYQPKTKLNLYKAERLASPVGLLAAEAGLATLPSLTTFSMTASHGTCIEDHMTFQVVLALAPNLKFASLVSLPLMRPGDPELASRWRAKPELWFPKEYANRRPNSALRHLTLDGWCLSAETLDYWSRYVNLACLESFKCSRGSVYASFFQRAPQLLTRLKHISLNLNPQERNDETAAAIEQYIATCAGLSSLSLWSWRGGVSLSTILSRHGPTLTALHLHEREDSWYSLRDTLSAEELRSIRQSCPQLKELTFDINRTSQLLRLEEYGVMMEELRKFKLDKLQIYLDCGVPWLADTGGRYDHDGKPVDDRRMPDVIDSDFAFCSGDDQFRFASPVRVRPRASENADREIVAYPPSSNKQMCSFLVSTWKTVFGSQTQGARQLTIKSGEWERLNTPVLPRLRGQRDVRVCCRAWPHQRDDKQGTCEIEIICCQGEHKRRFTSR